MYSNWGTDLSANYITKTYIYGFLDISNGNLISRNSMFVGGDTSMNSNLSVGGNINASNYFVNGVPFTGQWTTSIGGSIYYTGNVIIGKTTNNSNYALDISGNTNITGNLNVSRDVSMNANLYIGGNIIIGNPYSISDAIHFSGTVTDNITMGLPYSSIINRNFDPSGGSNIQLNNAELLLVQMNDGSGSQIDRIRFLAPAHKFQTFTNSITPVDTSSFYADNNYITAIYINPSGYIGINNNNPQYLLDVCGNTNITGNLNVSRDVSMNANLYIGGNSFIYGNLNVSRDFSMNANLYVGGNLYASGNINASNYFINGALFTGTTQWSNIAGGSIYYAGNVAIGKTTIISGYALDISGTTYISGNLNISRDVSMNANLYVYGNLNVKRDVSMNANLYVGGNIFVGNPNALENAIHFLGTATDNPFIGQGGFPYSSIINRNYDPSGGSNVQLNNSELLLLQMNDGSGGQIDRIRFLAPSHKFQTFTNSTIPVDASSFYADNSYNTAIYINPSGYVGVNNNNPQYPLDVNGSINTNSYINLNTNGINFTGGQGYTSGIYNIDAANPQTNLNNGGTIQFPNFSGFILVNALAPGYIQAWLCGGGSTVLLGQTGNCGSFAQNSGISGYTYTSAWSSSSPFTFFTIRTRGSN